MNYRIIRKLPEIDEVINEFPLSEKAKLKIKKDQEEVKNILEGKDNRLLLVVGPCSAWPNHAVFQYAENLLKISKEIEDKIKIVMRVYIQKPRTTKGWIGAVNQPDPFASPDISSGIKYAREMMVKVVEMGLPIADEALFTHNAKGFLELLSWVAIGARSTEDQEHRIFASALDCAVGLKNPTHGSLKIGVNSIVAAQHSHTAAFDGYEVQTSGNSHAHLVLRGGAGKPNYSNDHLEEVLVHMNAAKILNPAVVIDASHDNCLVDGKKNHQLQPKIIFDILENIKNRPELKNLVKGFMVESFLLGGNQNLDNLTIEKTNMSGLSITDPCLSWEETVKMISELYNRL